MVGASQVDPPAPSRRGPVPKDVRRAIDCLRAGIGRKVTTADLVAASGVAERTLRKHFRDFVGVSPLSYLRRLRLAAVRDELIGSAETVSITEVAIRHGFNHLGRFSLNYRRCFGESPSETVRKSRRDSARSAGCGQLQPGISRAREKPSIAVLPLDGRATEPTVGIFAAGASEKIAITLSRSRSISVVVPAPSRTRGADPRLPAKSGARYLLTGKTARSGARLRVILCLVDTLTGYTVWGDSYDGEVADPFALQDRVAEGVARAIVPNIRNAEIELARRRRAEDLDAYGLTMRAYPLAVAANPEAARRALELLDRAMEVDPDYALPPALAGWCHAQLVLHNGTPEPAAEKAQALLLAHRAGILDYDDPLVLTARCAVHTMAREFDVADAILARVLASEPDSAWVWERSGWLKTLTGEAETAIQHFRRAISLDRSGATNANRFVGLGSAHFHAGRYDEGARWMRQALLDQPATAWVNRTLAVSYARTDR